MDTSAPNYSNKASAQFVGIYVCKYGELVKNFNLV